ncbi:MAG TPA: carboxypeptidase regulatory-like domain-containing protein [Thermodesulfobacteriota bacterium]|nr:carboxypeptidase regulatory-like domain-containing protein [Thermodesulfobacteriota bacterium]
MTLVKTTITQILIFFTMSISEAAWLSPVKLTDNYATDQVPAISGDGKRIVYYSDEDGDNDIYLLTLNGRRWSNPIKLTDNDFDDFLPDINFDGTCITYHGGEGEQRNIYSIEEKDGTWGVPGKLTDGIKRDYYPSIDHNGEKITYMARLDEGDKTYRDVYVIERKDGIWQTPLKLTSATVENIFPVMSGDGEVIAFHGRAFENADRDIYAIHSQGNQWTAPLLLTENDTTDMQTAINGDRTRIVYYWMETYQSHMTPGANAEIHLLEFRDATWQEPVPLTSTPLYEYDPTISADGKRVTFDQADGTSIEKIGIIEEKDGIWGSIEILTDSSISGFRPNINSNGDKIVFYGLGTTDSDFEIYLLEDADNAATIHGTVVKADTGEAMNGVVLETQPGRYLAGTDAGGNFTLKVLPGSYTITPQADCYQSISPVRVKGIRKGEVVELTIPLTAGNCFPSVPSNPQPQNGAQDQPRSVTLRWQGGDPDEGDEVFYDVYLGIGTEHHIEMEVVSPHQKETSYIPQGLWYDTTYYWTIVARDKEGAEKTGPRWSFTTIKASISGTIANEATGEPIKGCNVLLLSPENGMSGQTRSDAQGRYGFESLVPGQYYIFLFKKGYSVEYCLVDYGGESVTRDFTLQTLQ